MVVGKGHLDFQEYWDGEDLEDRETLKVRTWAGGGPRAVWVVLAVCMCEEGSVRRKFPSACIPPPTHPRARPHHMYPHPPTHPHPPHSCTQSWFDDRVECRNALSKLPYLNGLKDLDRAFLPWTRYPEERDVLIGAGISDAVLTENDA